MKFTDAPSYSQLVAAKDDYLAEVQSSGVQSSAARKKRRAVRQALRQALAESGLFGR